jgi:hypothetical protein
MSPKWGSTPRFTDWLIVSRIVTLALTLILSSVQISVGDSQGKFLEDLWRLNVCVIITVILKVLQLLVVTTNDDLVNQLINRSPRLSHSNKWQYESNYNLHKPLESSCTIGMDPVHNFPLGNTRDFWFWTLPAIRYSKEHFSETRYVSVLRCWAGKPFTI